MSFAQPPRPFDVGDRVRTKKSTEAGRLREAGVVLEFRDRTDFDTLVAFDGKEPAGFWRHSHELEIEDADA